MVGIGVSVGEETAGLGIDWLAHKLNFIKAGTGRDIHEPRWRSRAHIRQQGFGLDSGRRQQIAQTADIILRQPGKPDRELDAAKPSLSLPPWTRARRVPGRHEGSCLNDQGPVHPAAQNSQPRELCPDLWDQFHVAAAPSRRSRSVTKQTAAGHACRG